MDSFSCQFETAEELDRAHARIDAEVRANQEKLAAINAQIAAAPSGIEKEVCADIARRQQLGIAKYGTTVANNPLELRDWLQHSLEETLDNAIYLKRAISEIDKITAAKDYVIDSMQRWTEQGGKMTLASQTVKATNVTRIT